MYQLAFGCDGNGPVWTEVSKYKYQVALCFLGNLVQRLLLRLFARALLSSRLFSKAAFAFQQRRTTLSRLLLEVGNFLFEN
jgi:hypothetical protein